MAAKMVMERMGGDGDEAKYGGDDGDEEMERDGGGITVAVQQVPMVENL
jgi:hypothetical protein